MRGFIRLAGGQPLDQLLLTRGKAFSKCCACAGVWVWGHASAALIPACSTCSVLYVCVSLIRVCASSRSMSQPGGHRQLLSRHYDPQGLRWQRAPLSCVLLAAVFDCSCPIAVYCRQRLLCACEVCFTYIQAVRFGIPTMDARC